MRDVASLLVVMSVVALVVALPILVVRQLWIDTLKNLVVQSNKETTQALKDSKSSVAEAERWLMSMDKDHTRALVDIQTSFHRLEEEVRTIAGRINQCEAKEVKASEEIAKGHRDQAKMAHLMLSDLQRTFAIMAAEYKPLDDGRPNPKGFDRPELVEKRLTKDPNSERPSLPA